MFFSIDFFCLNKMTICIKLLLKFHAVIRGHMSDESALTI